MKDSEIKNRIFKKASQNELKDRFVVGLEEVYGKDSKMVNWCLKQIAYLVPICSGKYIIELSKPSIETEFWFGESDMGQGPSHEENTSTMKHVRSNIVDYFINKNLSSIDDMIDKIKAIINDTTYSLKAKHYINYYKSSDDSPIHGFVIENINYGYSSVNGETWDVEKKDLKTILEAYQLLKKDFKNRLETYIKKYGTRKMYVHSYWMDA